MACKLVYELTERERVTSNFSHYFLLNFMAM